jgi:hypothetical protein
VKSCEEFVRELQDRRLLPRRLMTADSLIDPAPAIALRLQEFVDAAVAAERERCRRAVDSDLLVMLANLLEVGGVPAGCYPDTAAHLREGAAALRGGEPT